MKKKPIRSVEGISAATSFRIEREDIMADLTEKKGSTLFLGRYPMSAVMAALEKKSFFKDAKKRKLWPLIFELDSSEYPPLQRFQIFCAKKETANLVVDLKLKEFIFEPKNYLAKISSYSAFKLLYLEWLTLQNPLLQFTSKRPPLPGQVYPGLKLGKKVLDMFTYLARLNHDDGIIAFPCYFHNALLFSRFLRFVRPEKRGEVLAIRKAFRGVSFVKLAWIIHLNCLRTGEGDVFEWKAEEQLYPMNSVLKKYFDTKEYKERVKAAASSLKFSIDWDCYEKKEQAAFQSEGQSDPKF
jgi:hypothetical protein